MSAKRQKNQLVLAFTEEGRREAPKAPREGTESLTAKGDTERPARHEQLMEEVCERENCWQAYKRVKANKGSPGIDGRSAGDLSDYLKQHESLASQRWWITAALWQPPDVPSVSLGTRDCVRRASDPICVAVPASPLAGLVRSLTATVGWSISI